MRKLAKALVLSGILALGGVSWLAGPTAAYAAPLPAGDQTQHVDPVEPQFWREVARLAWQVVKAFAAGYAFQKGMEAAQNGIPGSDSVTVPEGAF